MSMIEGLVFNGALTSLTTRDIMENALRGFVSTAISVPTATLLAGRFNRRHAGPQQRVRTSVFDYAWKFPVAAAVYVFVYWFFGYFVAWQFPGLRQYYSGTTELVPFLPYTAAMIGSFPWFFLLQLGRGLLFVLLALLSLKLLGRGRMAGVAGVCAIFALFGLQLMAPNPMMPDIIRIPHLIETTSSMLLYGIFLGWFLQSRLTSPAAAGMTPHA
jgi:hypothetical protein